MVENYLTLVYCCRNLHQKNEFWHFSSIPSLKPDQMKIFYLTTKITLFLLFGLNGLQAQTIQTKLDQIELMKQFLGNWQCESGKDTMVFWNAKPYGIGFEVDYKTLTKGNMIMEAKQLFGYDKKTDKYLAVNMIKGMDIEIWAIWFISNKNFELMQYSDMSDPEKAIMKVKGEFKSPDNYVETIVVNNKPVKTYNYILIK
jgi:hypothetical protein